MTGKLDQPMIAVIEADGVLVLARSQGLTPHNPT